MKLWNYFQKKRKGRLYFLDNCNQFVNGVADVCMDNKGIGIGNAAVEEVDQYTADIQLVYSSYYLRLITIIRQWKTTAGYIFPGSMILSSLTQSPKSIELRVHNAK